MWSKWFLEMRAGGDAKGRGAELCDAIGPEKEGGVVLQEIRDHEASGDQPACFLVGHIRGAAER